MTSKILWIVCGILTLALAGLLGYALKSATVETKIEYITKVEDGPTDVRKIEINRIENAQSGSVVKIQVVPAKVTLRMQNRLPEIKSLIIKAFRTPVEFQDRIIISTVPEFIKDITSDGVAEIVVGTGQDGATATVSAIIRQVGNELKIAQCKSENGVYPCTFGQAGALRYSVTFKLVSNGALETSMDFEGLDRQYVLGSKREVLWKWNPQKEYLEVVIKAPVASVPAPQGITYTGPWKHSNFLKEEVSI